MAVVMGIAEARTRLSALVDQVASGGGDVLITKRGRPMARLVPVSNAESRATDALRFLLAAREASRPDTGSLRGLIDAGR